MTSIEYDLTNPLRLAALTEYLNKHWMGALNDKKPLRVIVVDSEAKRNAEQNKYYWGVVIKSIADQAWVGGMQFSSAAWHEQSAQMFGIKEEIRLPNGTLTTRRKSTTDMKVREFSQYIDEVCAWAGTELGVRFPAPEYL